MFEEVGKLISSSEHYILYVSMEIVYGTHKYICTHTMSPLKVIKKKKFSALVLCDDSYGTS